MPFRAVALLFAVLLFAAPAPAASKLTYAPDKAYIGGNFTLTQPTFNTAFVLVEQTTKEEVYVRFTADLTFDVGHNETLFTAVPPGTYKVTHWIVYNAFWGGTSYLAREFKAEVRPGKLSEPIEIKAGDVLFLGKFTGGTTGQVGYFTVRTDGSFRALPLSEEEAKALTTQTYPDFAPAPFRCHLCAGRTD